MYRVPTEHNDLSFRRNPATRDDEKPSGVNTKSIPYRTYLIALAFVPMIGLSYKFVLIQKIYAILGSLVIPFISIALLMLNREKALGSYKNKAATDIFLVFTIALFVYLAII